MFRIGPCWPFRWLHRRGRRADVAVMWPAIIERAYATAGNGDTERRIRTAWKLFQEQPGQEHWRCACSDEDAAIEGLNRATAQRTT